MANKWGFGLKHVEMRNCWILFDLVEASEAANKASSCVCVQIQKEHHRSLRWLDYRVAS